MYRLDNILDHGFGLIRTFESCVQPRAFYRFNPPRDVDLRGKVAVVTGGWLVEAGPVAALSAG